MSEEIKYRIGYVDEEAQFIDKFQLKLSDTFDIVIFELTENLALDNLINNIIEADLDCLIVDYELNEAALINFNGEEIVERLREKHPHFPVFIITSQEEDYVLNHVVDGDIVRLKDELDNKLPILIQRITNKIETYHKEIESAENRIHELISKREESPLTIPEENELTALYRFLDEVEPGQKMLPDNLLQNSSITRLDEFVSGANAILEELKKIDPNG